MLTIITPTYNQIDKLERLKKALAKQTFKDFEWILAIDGCEKTKDWAIKNKIKYVFHIRVGRQYNEICNMAAKESDGEYLLFINGDSCPTYDDYLEQMNEYKHQERILSGLRINKDDKGNVISFDHRLKFFSEFGRWRAFKIKGKSPWEKQTSNGMIIASQLWDDLEGFDLIYQDYGVVDQDLCMRAHYEGVENWIVPQAMLDHYDTEDKPLNNNNYRIYEERKKHLQDSDRI